MKTEQFYEYQRETPESEDEQLVLVSKMQAQIAALDPSRVVAFQIIILEKPLHDDNPNDYCLIRDIAGTGAQKSTMFYYLVEYMNTLMTNCDLDEKEDAPTQQC